MLNYSVVLISDVQQSESVICACVCMDFPGGASGKELAANAGHVRDLGSIVGSGRSHEGGRGNPLQHWCLENPTDRWDWQVTLHKVTKSWRWLNQFSRHAYMCTYMHICILFHILFHYDLSQVKWAFLLHHPYLPIFVSRKRGGVKLPSAINRKGGGAPSITPSIPNLDASAERICP